MFDTALRPIKEQALHVPARALSHHVSADLVTAASLVVTLAAAAVIWRGSFALGLALWLVGRGLDGLDGMVARLRQTADDVGGYFDMVADTIGYAAIPLGIALALDTRAGWIATAFLLGSFYLNSVSWTFLSAVLERRGLGVASTGELTTLTMPPALIEGAETMAFFTLFLVFPSHAPLLFAIMALAVLVNVGQRLWFARTLRYLSPGNLSPLRGRGPGGMRP